MRASQVLSFPEGVSASADGDGKLAIEAPWGRVVLRRLAPPVRGALLRLVHPGDSVGRLAAGLGAAPGALAPFFFYVRHLLGRGLVQITASAAGRPLATLLPTGPSFALARRDVSDGPYLLSRFAYLRRAEGDAVLESPRSAARIILHEQRAAALACALMTPATIAHVARRVPGLSAEAAGDLASLFLGAGMLAEVDQDGASAEDADVSLVSWEFHDLLFHARSREGRHDVPVGDTCRFLGRLGPPPAVKPAGAGETIDLRCPDPERIALDDPPLARVMEQRRSIRDYAAEPITAGQLGEFLYRTARVRARWEEEVETPAGVARIEVTSRPYPSGGALFALEIYPVVQSCRDLAPGLYHYDPAGHRLERLSAVTAEVGQLVRHAGMAAGIAAEMVQVLLIFAARFQRAAWKYESLAYALILKEAGVLMQTMYLAATAMGLAPCALGTGDSEVFARAVGGNYYEESSVGEFLLGSTG